MSALHRERAVQAESPTLPSSVENYLLNYTITTLVEVQVVFTFGISVVTQRLMMEVHSGKTFSLLRTSQSQIYSNFFLNKWINKVLFSRQVYNLTLAVIIYLIHFLKQIFLTFLICRLKFGFKIVEWSGKETKSLRTTQKQAIINWFLIKIPIRIHSKLHLSRLEMNGVRIIKIKIKR